MASLLRLNMNERTFMKIANSKLYHSSILCREIAAAAIVLTRFVSPQAGARRPLATSIRHSGAAAWS